METKWYIKKSSIFSLFCSFASLAVSRTISCVAKIKQDKPNEAICKRSKKRGFGIYGN
ncbi:Uncharacterised protein [Helicobacter fennelliae]|uniref:Lipoprotein n=1 Tax=Helicobacter fennelliae TaxID=215 RepID=A0A2X3ELJ7_9HELI|nr:hypothetical protein [Helicobacter fennelliae]SQC36254.1 Uncharacterised protein [Helicobacter fennelliae]